MKSKVAIVILSILLAISVIFGGVQTYRLSEFEVSNTVAEETTIHSNSGESAYQSTIDEIQNNTKPTASYSKVVSGTTNTNTKNVEETVYVTRTGSKYHTNTCQYTRGKSDLRSMSESDARSQGYGPCSRCQ